MKISYILLAMLMVFLLPCLFTRNIEHENIVEQSKEEISVESESVFSIRVKDKDQVTELPLEEYVLGVVLGEMPANFELEALKAQAVATRTYSLRKILKQDKHENADVCTDASCCQAYLSESDYIESRGTKEDYMKVNGAVEATEGKVLYYQGDLIEATYFSCSGGMTEDAVAVWGTDVPYLQSVESPGEDDAKHYETILTYTKDEFLQSFELPQVSLTVDDIAFTFTEGGGVKEMKLFGTTFNGTEIRERLNLPSTWFSVNVVGNDVIIYAKGYGHRVGMSQYGADAMAVNGSTYDEILFHYYQGTELVVLSERELKAIFDKEGNL